VPLVLLYPAQRHIGSVVSHRSRLTPSADLSPGTRR
jgi:hypothetical protein